MGVPQTPRWRWIEAATDALAAGGPDAVRIEALAKTLGVTKGGFYGYFTDRNALLTEVLDRWEQRTVDEVLAVVEQADGDSRSRAIMAGRLTFAGDLLPVELAVRDWARRDQNVAERLRRVDNRRMELLRATLCEVCPDRDEVEARSLLAFCAAIGSHFLTADHPNSSRPEVLARAVDLLFRPKDQP